MSILGYGSDDGSLVSDGVFLVSDGGLVNPFSESNPNQHYVVLLVVFMLQI